jgi:hypothetical protein
MSITTGANVTLVADASNNASFPFGTRVFLSGVLAPVHWIAEDASLLHFQVPDMQGICSGEGSDCGYISLEVVPPTLPTTTTTTPSCTAAYTWSNANVSCPPFCPNAFPDAVPTLHGNAIVPALVQSDASVQYMPWSSNVGFYITSECLDTSFIRYEEQVCLNASLPESRMCAFGSGAFCKPCPDHALCPGGFRAWPLPGYYTSSESSSAIIACAAPAIDRCTGWNALASQSMCGYGYTGYACSACSASFYPSFDAVCEACPPVDSVGARLTPYALLVGAAAGIAVFGITLVFLVSKMIGGTMDANGERLVGLVTWSFTVIQVVSSVSQTAAPNLPATVAVMYKVLNGFQFQGLTLPSACFATFPFVNEAAIMSIALFVLLLRACLHSQALQPGSLFTRAARVCSILLTVMYGPVVNVGLSMLSCVDSDGQTVLQSNPSFQCFVGAHRVIAGVSITAIIGIVVLYPVLTATWLSIAFKKIGQSLDSTAGNAALDGYALTTTHVQVATTLGTTLRPSRWYFFHVVLLCLLLFYVVKKYICQPNTQYSAGFNAGLYLCILIALTCAFVIGKPYPSSQSWKLVVKIHAFVLTALAVALQLASVAYSENPSEGHRKAVLGLGFLVLIGAVLIFASLLLGFAASVVKGAKREAEVAAQEKTARKSLNDMMSNPMARLVVKPDVPLEPTDPTTEVENPILKSNRVLAARVTRASRVSMKPAALPRRESNESRVAWTPVRKTNGLTTARARPLKAGSSSTAASTAPVATTPTRVTRPSAAVRRPSRMDPAVGSPTGRFARPSAIARTSGLGQFRTNSNPTGTEKPSHMPARPSRTHKEDLVG